MPYESFHFELLRPRWVKIRDQWWGELLQAIVCLAIGGPYLYWTMHSLNQVAGVFGWVATAIGFGIAVWMIAYSLRDVYRALTRRSRLMDRWRRSRAHARQ